MKSYSGQLEGALGPRTRTSHNIDMNCTRLSISAIREETGRKGKGKIPCVLAEERRIKVDRPARVVRFHKLRTLYTKYRITRSTIAMNSNVSVTHALQRCGVWSRKCGDVITGLYNA